MRSNVAYRILIGHALIVTSAGRSISYFALSDMKIGEVCMVGLLWVIWIGAMVFLNVKIWRARSWRLYRGVRAGAAEYGRLCRERPDSAGARLSEAEFIEKFVAAPVGQGMWTVAFLALGAAGLPLLMMLTYAK